MSVRRDTSSDPVDLTIDGNEYAELRDRLAAAEAALAEAKAANLRLTEQVRGWLDDAERTAEEAMVGNTARAYQYRSGRAAGLRAVYAALTSTAEQEATGDVRE